MLLFITKKSKRSILNIKTPMLSFIKKKQMHVSDVYLRSKKKKQIACFQAGRRLQLQYKSPSPNSRKNYTNVVLFNFQRFSFNPTVYIFLS
jgi:hypothetical protein